MPLNTEYIKPRQTSAYDVVPLTLRDRVVHAIKRASHALEAQQYPQGYWLFELEADCTMPAEYVLMMHYMDEIDVGLQNKIGNYLRTKQQADGGWPLYHGGKFDLSCSVKAYYALKLIGDDINARHMVAARELILQHGGAARANVFTRFVLAFFRQVPWRAIPFTPVEIMLLPNWFPAHLSKISYWSRTVLVPLSILYTKRAKAKNPSNIHIKELFTINPEEDWHYFQVRSLTNSLFLILERSIRQLEFLIPNFIRKIAMRRAENWFIKRLNGEDGLGGILPPMAYAHAALAELGYPADHEYRLTTKKALRKLIAEHEEYAYAQPCLSPVWDTILSSMAILQSHQGKASKTVFKALDWLKNLQILDGEADWQHNCPNIRPGGWAFQFRNDYYPDVDDTGMLVWVMREADPQRYKYAIDRAIEWLAGIQSRNGGYGAFDKNNTYEYLNHIPFADHGALLDPPTADVSARCLIGLAMQKQQYPEAYQRCLQYLQSEQETDGSWFGRWGTNYIYGTWSVLVGLEAAGLDMQQLWIQRGAKWLKQHQRDDGGWGESNDSYLLESDLAGNHSISTNAHTAWAIMGLIAAGHTNSSAVEQGIRYLLQQQNEAGVWYDEDFNAPGFPRFFYLRYHGYAKYFPLWALGRYYCSQTTAK